MVKSFPPGIASTHLRLEIAVLDLSQLAENQVKLVSVNDDAPQIVSAWSSYRSRLQLAQANQLVNIFESPSPNVHAIALAHDAVEPYPT
jgi:hypothetical protein